jgi:hypothetical protein
MGVVVTVSHFPPKNNHASLIFIERGDTLAERRKEAG